MFNTKEPDEVLFFNKKAKIKMSEFLCSSDYPDFSDFKLCWWISEENMTDEEKEENETYKTTGGFLKSVEYKTACSIFWRKTTKENKKKIMNLPNFDADIFKEITGIDVEKKTKTIVIDNKEIEISDESYKELKKSLL